MKDAETIAIRIGGQMITMNWQIARACARAQGQLDCGAEENWC